MKKFKTVTTYTSTSEEFDTEVEQLINDGWVPVGSTSQTYRNNVGISFCISLIKEVEEI